MLAFLLFSAAAWRGIAKLNHKDTNFFLFQQSQCRFISFFSTIYFVRTKKNRTFVCFTAAWRRKKKRLHVDKPPALYM